jgi:hypothetical protein
MPAKMLALMAQAGLAVVAWWMTLSDDERRLIQAGFWRELERLSMRLAKETSNLAAYAEQRYKQTVSA